MKSRNISYRLKHAWNAFKYEEASRTNFTYSYGMSSTIREDRTRLKPSNERSIIASVYTRIATDVAAIPLKHVRVDSNDRYKGTINSGLNTCLSLEANIDQTGREFILDAVLSMFDEGHVALVPIETQDNLLTTSSIDILSMRVGKVTQWFPRYVRVEVYNDNIGKKQEITLPKDKVAIIENPFYSVMNEPNSTLRRLNHKLNLLDVIDDQTSSGKLDLIIQLPYVIKTEQRRQEAEKRRKQIEEQLAGTKYGIAYTDGSERVTQLNRSLENNLMSQIEYLTSMLYSQLGLTKSVFDGTADEATQLNYYNSTIEPILSAFADEMKRKFLTKTARTQGQSILFIRDPFRLVSMDKIADIADKFTRNEILSTNDIRSIIGMQPVDDPRADELRNKNLNASDAQLQNPMYTTGEESSDTSGYSQGVEQDQGDGQYDLLSQLGLR